MANVDTNEEFWGITLSGEKKVETWNPSDGEEDVEHKIQVTQACLGHKAKEGERNIIEATTEDDDGNKISCAIVSLRVGFVECMHLELGFTNPVKFMLKEGSGPISLCGVHLSALPLDLDDNEDDDVESSDEDDEDVPQLVEPAKAENPVVKVEVQKKVEVAPPVVEEKEEEAVPAAAAAVAAAPEEKKADETGAEKNGKKRTLPEVEEKEVSAKKSKAETKVVEPEAKKVEEEEEEDDDDDEDDMADIDMDDLDDDDDDDEDEDEDMDSDDDDDEDDDEDEEEEEEETPKPKKKPPPKVNGHPPKKPTTPAAKQTPKENATPKAKPTKDTPAKKDTTTTPKKNPEELRTFLLKSPNLPKKYEKFSNFLKNNMKVTDSKTQKDLWEFVQKNKK